MAFLEIRGVSKYFGGLAAIDCLDLDVYKGEIIGLIGPNGAGKTTLFNVISGFYQPTEGTISFKGENLVGQRMDIIAKKGVVRTWQQTSALLHHMTALENVLVGFHLHVKSGFLKSIFNTISSQNEENEIKGKAIEILEFMGMGSVKNEIAGNLPHGHQRSLGVATALAANPELFLLDEPITGMNPTESLTMMATIRKILERGITVVIVEHDMKAVMTTCERIVVLNFGKKIAEGKPEEIRKDKDVIKAYLGTRA
jgi:branched-chain amino acid transport system ATP-binding protein